MIPTRLSEIEPPPARTAGEQDHSDPSVFTGEPADAPEDTGEPPVEARGADHPDLGRFVLLDVIPDFSPPDLSEPQARGAWRTCTACDVKRREINARWPARSRRSDGTIGDAAHASRKSDHNPWVKHGGKGIVRADDIDVNGIDAGWYAEHVRLMGAAGDRRLNPGGMVILNRRIAGTHTGWKWKVYTGSNPHTSHVHTSYSSRIADFDHAHPWGIFGGMPAPPPPPPSAGAPGFPLPAGYFYGPLDGPDESVSNLGKNVRPEWRDGLRRWQERMKGRGWDIGLDGQYGPQTNEVARRFQQEKRLVVDGLIGPATYFAAWTAPVS